MNEKSPPPRPDAPPVHPPVHPSADPRPAAHDAVPAELPGPEAPAAEVPATRPIPAPAPTREYPVDAPTREHPTHEYPAGASAPTATLEAPAPAPVRPADLPRTMHLGTDPGASAPGEPATVATAASTATASTATGAPEPAERSWNPAPPGFLGVANVIVSAVIGVMWLWLPISILFVGIGGIFAAGAGIICLFLWFLLQRGINHVERLRAEAVYADGIPAPTPPVSRRTGFAGFLETQWLILRSSAFWRSTAHHIVKALYGLFAFTLAIVGAGLGLVLLAGAITPASAEVFTIGDPAAAGFRLLNGALGVTGILVALALLWFAPYLDRALDRGLLPTTQAAALRAEVHTLDRARVGAVDAATAERLRIERDLHDGVQPMLVAMSMKLGMAKSKFDSHPDDARQLLTEAHAESKVAITELRQLARGIHPAVLTDRGLDPAISALAARSVIPVDVHIDLPRRPGTEAESVAYFVVAESLTNIAKHSGASRARVSIVGDGRSRQISVTDDGRGGAQVNRDGSRTGLAGLADRVTSARGTLSLTSPAGGPTTIVAEVPCAS